MGRYYSGDIEGKFWFGVQSSNDPSFFGGVEIEPNYLKYVFDDTHLPEVEAGLKSCRDALRNWKPKLDAFFKDRDYYNDQMLVEAGIPLDQIRHLLSWYARLDLGEKILHCVQEKGVCEFEAEF